MVGGISVGVPELFFLVAVTWWLVTLVAAVWALATLYRMRRGQEAMRGSLERIERLLQRP